MQMCVKSCTDIDKSDLQNPNQLNVQKSPDCSVKSIVLKSTKRNIKSVVAKISPILASR